MIELSYRCENCSKVVKIKVAKLFEVWEVLRKMGWLHHFDLTLCPDCRGK